MKSRMAMGLMFLAGLLMVGPTAWAEGVWRFCDARAFGAKGDGVTKDTVAILAAIDGCAGGKGTARLTAGTYLSAPIV